MKNTGLHLQGCTYNNMEMHYRSDTVVANPQGRVL